MYKELKGAKLIAKCIRKYYVEIERVARAKEKAALAKFRNELGTQWKEKDAPRRARKHASGLQAIIDKDTLYTRGVEPSEALNKLAALFAKQCGEERLDDRTREGYLLANAAVKAERQRLHGCSDEKIAKQLFWEKQDE